MAILRQLTGEVALSAAVQNQSLRVRINHESKCHSGFFFWSGDILARSKGDTPLHYAASYGHKDIAELLLSNRANVDAQDGIGRTSLCDAARGGRIEEVGMLLTAQADVNARTLRGYTALSAAASYGREDVARLLIDNGANVNAADLDGGTPLHWARVGGYERIEDLLRQHGALELPRAKSGWPYP